MKNDFKIGQSIIIEKPGILNGLHGKIIGINTESNTLFKPLRIECESGYTIALEFHEILGYQNKDNATQTSKTSVQAKETVAIKDSEYLKIEVSGPIGELAIAYPKQKRAYTKRGSKPKEVKIKRKYTKKAGL